jgi:hypothetical protein
VGVVVVALFFLFCMVLGIETRTWHILGKCCIIEPYSQPGDDDDYDCFVVLGIELRALHMLGMHSITDLYL